MGAIVQNIKNNKLAFFVAGVASITVGYALYRAWIYYHYGTGDDEYFERLKTSSKPEKRKILIIGIDGSGKTRFSRCFCKGRRILGPTEETTIGFYVNTVKLGVISLDMWDDEDSLIQKMKRANYQAFLYMDYKNSGPPTLLGHGWTMKNGICVPSRYTRLSLPLKFRIADSVGGDEDLLSLSESTSSSDSDEE